MNHNPFARRQRRELERALAAYDPSSSNASSSTRSPRPSPTASLLTDGDGHRVMAPARQRMRGRSDDGPGLDLGAEPGAGALVESDQADR